MGWIACNFHKNKHYIVKNKKTFTFTLLIFNPTGMTHLSPPCGTSKD